MFSVNMHSFILHDGGMIMQVMCCIYHFIGDKGWYTRSPLLIFGRLFLRPFLANNIIEHNCLPYRLL